MPFLIAIAAAFGTVVFWMYRARMARDVASDLADVASDVLGAARRFGFRRRANQHPVDSIDQPELAIGALAMAFIELDAMPVAEQRLQMTASLGRHLSVSLDRAEEVSILGHWLVNQCQGPAGAIERISKRLFRINGAASLDPLMNVLKDVTAAGNGGLSPRQKDALADIARYLRVR